MIRPKTAEKASYFLLLLKLFTSDIDGGYSEWTEWSVCSHDCGGGRKIRHRLCVNPPQQGKGQFCSGADIQTKTCNRKRCNRKRKQNYFKSRFTVLSQEPSRLITFLVRRIAIFYSFLLVHVATMLQPNDCAIASEKLDLKIRLLLYFDIKNI